VVSLPYTIRHLIEAYETFQGELSLREAEPELHDLVRFNGNKGLPVHGWFTFKEGFSAELLPWLCQTIPCKLDDFQHILDPFCGVGTSLLAAQLAYRGNNMLHAYGIEHNPFICFVAQAKLSWSRYRRDRIEELIPKLIAPRLAENRVEYQVPGLSTVRNPRVFTPSVVQELLAFRDRIQDELSGEPEKSFFLLGWAAVIERVSGVRKDGRALRFKEKDDVPTVAEALRGQWELMLSDLHKLAQHNIRPLNVECKVLAGDGRTLLIPELEKKEFDLILYSPPYLNNIDYSEVYKLELWLSGKVSTQEEFRILRLGTVRSHPSVKFPETDLVDRLPEDSWPRHLREALLMAVPDNKDRTWRIRLIRGYMDDMYQALSAQFRVARPNTPVVCVVGNSLHGRRNHPIPIATDLLISALAQAVGFEVEWLQIARQLRRRDHSNKLLRESIILMRRP
jgi:DNA modification methylase